MVCGTVGLPSLVRRLYDVPLLGQDLLGNCVNMNGAPRMRTPSRLAPVWRAKLSCPGGDGCMRGPPVGVLRSAAHCGGPESRFWGVFIIAVHRAFVLGGGPASRYCGAVRLTIRWFYIV